MSFDVLLDILVLQNQVNNPAIDGVESNLPEAVEKDH